MFQVFDNGKPAQYPDHKVHESWTRSAFTSFQEARDYAMRWLGEWAPLDEDCIELGIPFDYSGLGDIVLVREI